MMKSGKMEKTEDIRIDEGKRKMVRKRKKEKRKMKDRWMKMNEDKDNVLDYCCHAASLQILPVLQFQCSLTP